MADDHAKLRTHAERRRRQRMTRLRLELIEYATDHNLDELLTKALDEVGALVDSPIGFYHFVDDDGQVVLLQQWSTRTLQEFCQAEAKGHSYDLDKAGVWVDCVRVRAPVVHNDYPSLPHKRGMPDGHAEVVRELVTPVIRNQQVVAILGVGNKPTDYTEFDVEIVSHLADVTFHIVQQKRVEEALRRSEEKYRLLFENVMNGFALHEIVVDETGSPVDYIFLEVNAAFEQLTGLKREMLIGRRVTQVLPGIEDDPTDWIRKYGRVALSGEEIRFESYAGPLDRWYSVLAYRTQEGQFAAIFEDITERKRAERARQASEALLNQSQAIAHLGSWELDLLANRLTWSDEVYRIFGLEPQEFKATYEAFLDAVHPDDREAVDTAYTQSVREGQEGYEITHRIVRADTGAVRTVHVKCFHTHGEDGQVVRSVGMVQDITEAEQAERQRQALEAQLRQSRKMQAIGRLAGGVAHDFNNLLTVIINYAELSLAQLGEGDSLRDDIEPILEAGERAAMLTRQLLAFSRRQVMEPRILDLNEIVSNLESMLRRLIGEDIELRVVLSDDLGRIDADPHQLEQVVMNLAINARDAMPGGGRLTIETLNAELDTGFASLRPGTKAGRYVLLSVTDTGAGMSAEVQERIFEPFFTTKATGQGTGLGLATVYGIVKQSGGNIWVYSEPGKGTTFKIYLPQVESETLPPTREVDTTQLQGTEWVLVVEDEAAVRHLTERILESAGYTVVGAASAGEALLECERYGEQIDLVLTDVIMPQTSGRALSDRLAELYPSLKVLFMSGYTDNAIVHHGVLDEGRHFIAKPFTAHALLKKVRFVLDCD